MYKIKLVYDDFRYLSSPGSEYSPLDMISFFLNENVIRVVPDLAKHDFILDGKLDLDISFAEKEGDFVHLNLSYGEPGPDVIVPYDNFLQLLDRWKEIYVQRPPEVYMIMDDKGNVTIDSKKPENFDLIK